MTITMTTTKITKTSMRKMAKRALFFPTGHCLVTETYALGPQNY